MSRRRIAIKARKLVWDSEEDGRTCSLDVEVKGETFHIRQPFPRSILIPIAASLGRKPLDNDLERIALARIDKWLFSEQSDYWPASLPLTLTPIDYRNVGRLVEDAGLRSHARRGGPLRCRM